MELDKFPSIDYPREVDGISEGVSAVVTEKYDGANMRFTVTEDDEILCGSRNVVFKENGEPQDLDRVNKQFRHSVKYLQRTVDIDMFNELFGSEDDVTIFGESLHKHSVEYDAWNGKHPDIDSSEPNFVMFDVMVDGDFVEWDKLETIGDKLGLKTANLVYRTDNLDLDEVDIPQSEYRSQDASKEIEFNKEGLAEGVVIRNDNTGDRAKLVHEQFKEIKGSSQTEPKHSPEIYNKIDKYTHKYTTQARVEKLAHKLIDESSYENIGMHMMEDLHKKVYEDILEESEENIKQELDTEELETLHNEIANKTAAKLQQTLTN
jgi:hypothetical protein